MTSNEGAELLRRIREVENKLDRVEAKLDALVNAILEAEQRDTVARIRAQARGPHGG